MNRFLQNLVTLVITVGLGTALFIWLATVFTFFQTILGLMVVLVLPGYVLLELLMGRRTLGTVQHLFMVLSGSLAIAILSGLALNQLPVGIRMDGWLTVFAGTTMGGGVLAWLLRHRRRSQALVTQRVPVRISQLLFIGIAVLLAGEALDLARTPAAPDGYMGYTMLWMVPAQDGASNHLHLGIDSKEFVSTQYRLELMVNDQVAQEWSEITLVPNQQWQANLAFNAEELGRETLQANLYRLDAPEEIYRHVVLRPQVSAAQE
ncbi:MAG: DUF1616 domain-containing protein [Caldilineaceae bacterium]|nr:DUF1616 domain-containing protein [Caldilineaceae bacterium]